MAMLYLKFDSVVCQLVNEDKVELRTADPEEQDSSEHVKEEQDSSEHAKEEPTRPSFSYSQQGGDIDSLQFITEDQNIQNILRKPNIGISIKYLNVSIGKLLKKVFFNSSAVKEGGQEPCIKGKKTCF